MFKFSTKYAMRFFATLKGNMKFSIGIFKITLNNNIPYLYQLINKNHTFMKNNNLQSIFSKITY